MDNVTSFDVNSEIYKQLIQLIPDILILKPGEGLKSHATNAIDLTLDILNRDEDKIIIALSQYFKHESGDLIPSPDMEIRIFPTRSIAEALSYQDALVIEGVYLDENRFYPRLKKKLNLFLYRWLKSCLAGGINYDDEG